MSAQLHQGDCREVMRGMAENSVDSIVTDPPYHLTTGKKGGTGEASVNLESPYGRARIGTGFMGLTWDGGDVAFEVQTWREALRVAKPGAYLAAFGGTRTFHRLACAIEDAGWELRDTGLRGHTPEDCPWLMGWLYGSGFPKSHNGDWGGTALKPAWEPIVLARKPLEGTVEANWRKWGTGALNIDDCRIGTTKDVPASASTTPNNIYGAGMTSLTGGTDSSGFDPNIGRWPANVIHDGSDGIVSVFPSDSGQAAPLKTRNSDKTRNTFGAFAGSPDADFAPHDERGSAARFFYCAKASREDRNEGLDDFTPITTSDGREKAADNAYQRGKTERANHHPTVKPTELMRWLVRLMTPKGGTVLDPFMGSGSTGKAAMLEGFGFTGIDLTPEYIEIARARIEYARRMGYQPSLLEAA